VSNEWTLGELMCKLSRYVQGVVIVNCILTLTGIAADRSVAYKPSLANVGLYAMMLYICLSVRLYVRLSPETRTGTQKRAFVKN